MKQQRVVLVSTGGTIASDVDERGRWAIRPGSQLLDGIPGLDRLGPVTVDDFSRLPSSRLSSADLLRLVKVIRTYADDDTVRGIVVTHGTDSMEESAFLIDLLVETPKPVVVTGAMRNITEQGPDGPRNIYASVLTAGSPLARGQGTVVVMNDYIHSARDVVKVNAKNPEAFQSPPFGPLGYLEADRLVWGRLRMPMHRYPALDALDTRVQLIRLGAFADGGLIRAAAQNGARALVLETLGAGALPDNCFEAAREAVEAGVHVIATTRCLAGTVGPATRRKDLIPAGDLKGSKARILAMVALGAGAGGAELRRAFAQPGLYTPPE